jgi:hypothetical protein
MDSCGPEQSGWHELTDEDRDVVGCVTVGMVESQDDTRITLALSREPSGQVDGAISIPLVAITGFRVWEIE